MSTSLWGFKHRDIVYKNVILEVKTLRQACIEADVSVRSGRRLLMMRSLSGSSKPLRLRKSIPRVKGQKDQDILITINARCRSLYHDELAIHLLQATGHA